MASKIIRNKLLHCRGNKRNYDFLENSSYRCDGFPSCSLSWSDASASFGDPCPGTDKYLEAHYTCRRQQQQQDGSRSKAGEYDKKKVASVKNASSSSKEKSEYA